MRKVAGQCAEASVPAGQRAGRGTRRSPGTNRGPRTDPQPPELCRGSVCHLRCRVRTSSDHPRGGHRSRWRYRFDGYIRPDAQVAPHVTTRWASCAQSASWSRRGFQVGSAPAGLPGAAADCAQVHVSRMVISLTVKTAILWSVFRSTRYAWSALLPVRLRKPWRQYAG